MKATTHIKGITIPLDMDDIDTDIIIPAQYLTSTSQEGFGEAAFARLRTQPEFVLNDEKYKNAPILITGKNFGCGSSREHAVWAIQELGIQAIIAPSFADIFFNNAKKNGLLLIQKPLNVVKQLMKASHEQTNTMQIDVVNQKISTKHMSCSFDIDDFFKHCLINGLNELDYVLSHLDIIKKFKKKQINNTLFIRKNT